MPTCTPGSKKFAKYVRSSNGKMKCVRYGDRTTSIKKHIPARKRSFCARHRCTSKTEPATPGYQSCKKWTCKVGKVSRRKSRKASRRKSRRKSHRKSRRKSSRRKSRKSRRKSRRSSSRRKSRRKSSRRKSRKSRRKSRKSTRRKSFSGRYSKCWKGYKRQGTKMKNGRRVPNCVKV